MVFLGKAMIGAGLRLVALLWVMLLLAACAPTAVQPSGQEAATLRDWFGQAELEAALLAAGVGPEDGRAALCSEDPQAAGHYSLCVQFGPDGAGARASQWWWVAQWDGGAQRVVIRWRQQVEVQF